MSQRFLILLEVGWTRSYDVHLSGQLEKIGVDRMNGHTRQKENQSSSSFLPANLPLVGCSADPLLDDIFYKEMSPRNR
jgi:hypothetical protein